MKLYCEIMFSSVMPAMRSIIARELLKTHGLTQKQTAKLLGLTQPAISQYKRESRGSNVKILEKHPEIMKTIDNIVNDVAREKTSAKELHDCLCNICRKLRETNKIIIFHDELDSYSSPFSECSTSPK